MSAFHIIIIECLTKKTWKDIKTTLLSKTDTEVMKLVKDLYALSEENKTFIHSRYNLGGDPLEPYKEIITEALYPDFNWNQPISLSTGRKAISDYYKSTKDKLGQIELMVHYLETGNQFTLDYGDIDEPFYASLERMFNRILNEIEKQPNNIQMKFLDRLQTVVISARDMGWGYYDYISEALIDYNDRHDF